MRFLVLSSSDSYSRLKCCGNQHAPSFRREIRVVTTTSDFPLILIEIGPNLRSLEHQRPGGRFGLSGLVGASAALLCAEASCAAGERCPAVRCVQSDRAEKYRPQAVRSGMDDQFCPVTPVSQPFAPAPATSDQRRRYAQAGCAPLSQRLRGAFRGVTPVAASRRRHLTGADIVASPAFPKSLAPQADPIERFESPIFSKYFRD
jgi:hypothetical protein